MPFAVRRPARHLFLFGAVVAASALIGAGALPASAQARAQTLPQVMPANPATASDMVAQDTLTQAMRSVVIIGAAAETGAGEARRLGIRFCLR